MGNWNNITLPSGVEIPAGRSPVVRVRLTVGGKRHTIALTPLAQYVAADGSLLPGAGVRKAVQAAINEAEAKVVRSKAALAAHERGIGAPFDFAIDFPHYAAGSVAAREPGDVTIGELLDQYFSAIRATKIARTVDKYEQHADNWIRPYWGDKPARELTIASGKAWLESIQRGLLRAVNARPVAADAPSISKESVERVLIPLNGAIDRAVEAFPLGNPLKSVKLSAIWPQRAIGETDEDQLALDDVEPFNDEERAAILAVASPEWRRLLTFWWGTGLRTGELFGLMSDKVATLIDGDYITIARQAVLGTLSARLKTATSLRRIPVLPGSPARVALEEQIAISHARAAAQDPAQLVHHIFGNVFTGEQLLDPVKWIQGPWKTLLRRAGVKYRSSYHNRHTFASLAIAAGFQLTTVAAIMGHKNTVVLQTVYGKMIKATDNKHGFALPANAADAFKTAA